MRTVFLCVGWGYPSPSFLCCCLVVDVEERRGVFALARGFFGGVGLGVVEGDGEDEEGCGGEDG
jgi:hypothetical protein